MSGHWNYFTQPKKILFSLVLLLCVMPFSCFSQTPTNRVDTILFNNFFFNQHKVDTVAVENKLDLFNFFNVMKCMAGKLYFSGNGFPGAISVKYKGNTAELRIYFEHCIHGSRFTIENALFETDGGVKPTLVNKTIVFQ
jgi:hypothetical protein